MRQELVCLIVAIAWGHSAHAEAPHASTPGTVIVDLDAGTSLPATNEANEQTESSTSEDASVPQPWLKEPQEEEEEAWADVGPNREAVISFALNGDVAILDPTVATFYERATGFGASFEALGRGKRWPFLIGAAAGVLSFADDTSRGPFYFGTERDGSFYIGTTTIERSVQLRHLEAVVRVQPWLGRVRPYLEGEFGLMTLFQTTRLHDDLGHDVVTPRDKQRSISYLTGGTVGIDIKLTQIVPDTIWSSDLLLSLGVKRLFTGPMESPAYAAMMNDGVQTTAARARLHLWQPFISLCLSVMSKPRPPPRAITK